MRNGQKNDSDRPRGAPDSVRPVQIRCGVQPVGLKTRQSINLSSKGSSKSPEHPAPTVAFQIDAKQSSRKASRTPTLRCKCTRPSSSRVIRSDGQKESMSRQKKCGEPLTPRTSPSCQSARTRSVSAAVFVPRPWACATTPSTSGSEILATLLEKGLAQGKTHGFSSPVVLAIGSGSQGQRGERGQRKAAGVETNEHVRSHLLAQLLDVCCGRYDIERHTIDKLEWPRSHSNGQVVSPEFAAPLKDGAKPHMGEWAPDIGEHVYRCHSNHPI